MQLPVGIGIPTGIGDTCSLAVCLEGVWGSCCLFVFSEAVAWRSRKVSYLTAVLPKW